MTRRRNRPGFWVISILLLLALALAGGQESAAAADEPLYVALIWHNHQPFYKNTATGTYMMPWVRLHAVKDYYDMVSILEDYPNVHVTFNMVPSLLFQLDEYAAGAKDVPLLLTEKPASDLTRDDKEYILRRFFDANWDNIIARYPRYWELLEKRGKSVSDESIAAAIEAYTEQDFRDLQVWFNLAWLDPDFIEHDPQMKALVEKARGYSEDDVAQVIAKHLAIVEEVVPLYREMQKAGRIEITTTPFYHPIMPLLYDTTLARVASPKLDLPGIGFAHPEDVAAQLDKAVQSYEEHFDTHVRGLWPSEQAVGDDIVGLVHDAGFEWMVSSEGVLARSLGIALRDGAGAVTRPDALYRPYIVEQDGAEVTILFRDIVLSDKIGFSYGAEKGRAAARDLMDYLRRVKTSLEGDPGPHIVTIALDGENCWEYYENDGKEFLHALYSALDADPDFKAVTVEEYLAAHPATERIPTLHTGSWISDNLDTWIGEAEENRAWDYLAKAREALAKASASGDAGEACDPSTGCPIDFDRLGRLDRAWDELYAAEGSDWFWWYGDDQDSGNDEAFDELFRVHLQNVYRYAGLPAPGYLYMPIISKKPAQPDEKITGLMKEADMDGYIGWGKWEKSSLYIKEDAPKIGAVTGEQLLSTLRVGVDTENLYIRIAVEGGFDDLYGQDVQIAVYVGIPRGAEANSLPRWSGEGEDATALGFPLGAEILVDFRGVLEPGPARARMALAAGDEAWRDVMELDASAVGEVVEIAVPFEALGLTGRDSGLVSAVAARGGGGAGAAAGETAHRSLVVDYMPAGGPAEFKVPVVSVGRRLFIVGDPEGDDYGPGTYTYPTNAVFTPGAFDLASFEVISDDDEVTFNVGLVGDIENHWNSGIGLSVQTIDIYIDTDRTPGSGLTEALGGRHVLFSPECAWEYAIWVEGWNQRVFTSDGSEVGGITAGVDTINNVVVITVPKSIIGDPQPGWGYQVFVLGQEGYPSQGNLRVREVMEAAAEWRFGGGDNSIFDPNVIDMLDSRGAAGSHDSWTQQQALSSFDVGERRLAVVYMVYPEF